MPVTAAVIDPLVTSNRESSYGAQVALKVHQELGGILIGYLRSHLKSHEDAHDMAQEVYLRIANQFEEREIHSLKAFVFAIARNLLTDNSRRCATRLAANCISIDDVAIAAPIGDPLEQMEIAEMLQKVSATVASLRPNCRQAYLLSRMNGFSYDQIAVKMNISVSMVEKHISAALCALRAESAIH